MTQIGNITTTTTVFTTTKNNDIQFNFKNIDLSIVIWLIVSILSYIIALTILFILFCRSRKLKIKYNAMISCCDFQGILRIIMLISIIKYIVTVIFIGSSNAELPTKIDSNHTTNESIYYALFIYGNSLSVYCLIIIFIHVTKVLDNIKPIKKSLSITISGMNVIIIDVLFCVYRVVMYSNTELNDKKLYTKTLVIIFYCILGISWFVFLTYIFIVKKNATVNANAYQIHGKNDYRLLNELNQLNVLAWLTVIWTILMIIYTIFQLITVQRQDNDILFTVSLWIQWIICANMLTYLTLFYLVPVKNKRELNKRVHRFSQSFPNSLSKKLLGNTPKGNNFTFSKNIVSNIIFNITKTYENII